MKTIKTVKIEPIFVEELPEKSEYKKNVIYISRQYKTSGHLCLCGCKELVIMPFTDVVGKWWQLIEEKEGVISFIGSVGNYNFDCKSHYVITKNKANFI